MKILEKLLISFFIPIGILAFAGSAYAMMPTLSLSPTSYGGDNVIISVSGDPNSSVILHYNLSSGIQARVLGNTNYNGFFSTTISGSNYGIPAGGSVYVIVNNQQSAYSTWPYSSYYSSASPLRVSSLALSVGNSAIITSSNSTGLYVSSNSNLNVASASFSSRPAGCTATSNYSVLTGQSCFTQSTNNTSVTISAISAGISTITLCQSSRINFCESISIIVSNPVQTSYSYDVYGGYGGGECNITRNLRYGMFGIDVYCLQFYLYSKGYLWKSSDLTSTFDLDTLNAVLAFQRDNYLSADGIVGSFTRERLY